MKQIAILFSMTLIPFYLYTAFAVFNPVVSMEYENYYINKSTPLSVREQQDAKTDSAVYFELGSDPINGTAKELLPITFGVVYRYDDQHHFLWKGFAPAEPGLRWSTGRRCGLYFRVDPGMDLSRPRRIAFEALPNGRQEIIVSVNGSQRFKRQLSQPGKIVLEIEPGVLRNGVNDLEIQIPWARIPANGDQRLLGFAISNVSIH